MEDPPYPISLPGYARYEVATQDPDGTLAIDPLESAGLSTSAVATRRQQFVLGRVASHRALRAAGLDDGPIVVGENREPVWPPKAVGSITHIEGMAAAMVAPRCLTDGIGLDLERARDIRDLEHHVITDRERIWLDRMADDERKNALLEVFSAKETVYKALAPSVGRFFGFDTAELEPHGMGYSAHLTELIDSRYPPGKSFDIGVVWSGDLLLTWTVLPNTKGC